MKKKIIMTLVASSLLATSVFAADATSSATETTESVETTAPITTTTTTTVPVSVPTTTTTPVEVTFSADGKYIVQDGDTLAKIAAKFNVSWRELAQVNNLANPNLIYIGDALLVPSIEDTPVEIIEEIVEEVPAIELTEAVTPSVDTISSASTGIYYQDGTWSHEKFVELFTDGVSQHAAISIATTNADGTPNAATIIPSFVEGETEYLKIAVGSIGNTVENLRERKYGVITAYQHNPELEDKFERNNGIRLVVEHVEDEALVAQFNEGNQYPDNTVYMKIVKYLPLG